VATAAAVGLSSFLSYQCAAAVKAVSLVAATAVAVTIAVAAMIVVATTAAVAKLIFCKKPLRKQGSSFLHKISDKVKTKSYKVANSLCKSFISTPSTLPKTLTFIILLTHSPSL
jgi:hypothetical protein